MSNPSTDLINPPAVEMAANNRVRLDFFGGHVVAAFAVVMFGWTTGFYGPAVYLCEGGTA